MPVRDDFLRAFFGAAPALRADRPVQPVVYTFDDDVRALQAPLNLLLRDGDTFIAATIDWRGGLRYPQLLRDEVVPDRRPPVAEPSRRSIMPSATPHC